MFVFVKNIFDLKNTFKVALQYLSNVVILLKTVFNLKLHFKLKIDQKTCTFKNLEEIQKTWKKFLKNLWQPCIMLPALYYFDLDTLKYYF